MNKDLSKMFNEIITCSEEIVKSGKTILSCAEAVISSLKDIETMFSVPLQAEPDVKEYTFEDVRGIMAGLSGQGKKKEARALLEKYGVSRLSELDENDYAAVAEEAKVIANG